MQQTTRETKRPTAVQRARVARAAAELDGIARALAEAFGQDIAPPQVDTIDLLSTIAAGLRRAAASEVWP